MSRFECTDHMKSFLQELPKCEHHLHLEGTLEPNLLFKLAERNKIQLPSSFPKNIEECSKRYASFEDLQDFLNHYYVGMSVLITEDDFYDLAMAYFTKAKQDGCLHSEVFFDPQGHVERGISVDLVVKGFDRACKDATKKLGTTNKLIMCLLRHLPASNGMETIKSVEKYYQQGIIRGLGLDSSEKPFPPGLFIDCYKEIKQKYPNVGLTAHAGEEGDYNYVIDSLDKLGASRIDHGINSKQSNELLARLAKNKTMLTMCPLSNVKLQVVKDVGELPINLFLQSDVPFSINSDDPAYFGGYILDNYISVHTRFGFNINQWAKIVNNGIEGSWCDDKRKSELKQILQLVIDKYTPLL